MVNVSNLLLYDTNNIKYQYHIKNATLSAKQNLPVHNIHLKPGKLSIHTEQAQIRQDSSNFFASIGLHKMSDLMRNAAQKGRQAALNAIAEYAKTGNQMADIDKGVSIAEILRQKHLQQTKTSLVVKSSKPVNISYTPGKVSTTFKPSSISIDWKVSRAMRRYSPADFNLETLQHPTIDFTYQGGFQYVPESARQNFNTSV